MSQEELKDLKILIMIKTALIVFIYLLIIIWHNSLPPAFVFAVLLGNSLFAISTIGDYGLYTFINKWRKKLDENYEKYEKTKQGH